MLLEAVLGIGTDLELGVTLQHIVDAAVALIGARYGALGVVRSEGAPLTELFSAGLDDPGRERAVRTGELPDEDAGHITVPVRVGSEVFGRLWLTGKREGPFSGHDQVLLGTLAAQAGIAIGNATTYGTARQRERWIQGAAAVTTALLTGETAHDALTTVAESARVLADADAGAVLLPTPDGGMRIAAASATDPSTTHDLMGTTIDPGSAVLDQLLVGEAVYIADTGSDPRMVTRLRGRFGPSMMLPLQHGGQLIGTLALPRVPGGRPYTSVDRLLASQFASQAALALVLADAQHNREQLAVYEDRDRIARDLHDLVVQRLFATEMMLESTRRRAGTGAAAALLGRATDELDSTIQEVRTAIFALQQPPAEAPTTLRGRILRETDGAAALLDFRPSVRFRGAVDSAIGEPVDGQLLAALRGALASAHRRNRVTAIEVDVDAGGYLEDGRPGVRLMVRDDGVREDGAGGGTTFTWSAPR